MSDSVTLVVGHIYFEMVFEDDEMEYPIIHSYEYRGLSTHAEDKHEFRCVGSNDLYLLAVDDLDFITYADGIASRILQWANKHPKLAFPR